MVDLLQVILLFDSPSLFPRLGGHRIAFASAIRRARGGQASARVVKRDENVAFGMGVLRYREPPTRAERESSDGVSSDGVSSDGVSSDGVPGCKSRRAYCSRNATTSEPSDGE